MYHLANNVCLPRSTHGEKGHSTEIYFFIFVIEKDLVTKGVRSIPYCPVKRCYDYSERIGLVENCNLSSQNVSQFLSQTGSHSHTCLSFCINQFKSLPHYVVMS
jgi:hypothetical protein